MSIIWNVICGLALAHTMIMSLYRALSFLLTEGYHGTVFLFQRIREEKNSPPEDGGRGRNPCYFFRD